MSSTDICDWQPSVDFDNEILAMQPDCDMTPENYKKATLAGNYFKSIGELKKEINEDTFEEGILPDIATKIQLLENATAIKPVGKQLIPTSDSEEELETFIREEEIITMQRKCGFNRHVEGIDSSKTVGNLNTISQPFIISKKNGVPILLDQMFFKFENHNKTSTSSDITSTSSDSSKQKSDEIQHEILKNSTTSEDESTDVATGGRSHFQQHKLKLYTPRELYEMKKGKPKYIILNTKKTKKILNNSK